jgi:radical SAM protein, TIGR01212 family
MPQKRPYNALSSHFRERFGERVQKIPLDAGFSCPNRDGTLSRAGCAFCNANGSGSGLLGQGLGLAAQWEHWRARLAKKYKARLFLAYLQSFSNTHGPAERLRSVLDELDGLPGRVGLCIGTRPDCLDSEKLDLLAVLPGETWLDLGLQSCRDETLRRINRGHDAACFARASESAARRGIKVCAHLIAGLPGESTDDFLAGIDFLNALPIGGIKLHNLYVCENTALAAEYRAGRYAPPERDEYVRAVCEALARLRPDIVVHRLTGDAAPGELLAPDWAAHKQALLTAVHDRLARLELSQGCRISE